MNDRIKINIETNYLTKYIPSNELMQGLKTANRILEVDYFVTSAHPIDKSVDANLFEKTLQKILKENNIDNSHFDHLLYFSYYLNEEYDRLKTIEYNSQLLKQRAQNIVDMLKLPFHKLSRPNTSVLVDIVDDNGEIYPDVFLPYEVTKNYSEKYLRSIAVDKPAFICGFSQEALEISKDVTITISGSGKEVIIDPSFNKQILEYIATLLLDNQRSNNTEFSKMLARWNNELSSLDNCLPDGIPQARKNKILVAVSRMVQFYLEDNKLISRGRATEMSDKQSIFLFEYFSLLQALEKKDNFIERFEIISSNRKKLNYYELVLLAYKSTYSNPTTYMRKLMVRNSL